MHIVLGIIKEDMVISIDSAIINEDSFETEQHLKKLYEGYDRNDK